MREIRIIPDVHGRTFWRSAVESAPEGTRFVFLGDYLDPYPWEEIYPEDATVMLEEIIALGRERSDDVVLLLGNHDMGYLDPDINFCRRDHRGAFRNKQLLEENLDLFQMVHVETVAGIPVLFSHAGIAVSWVERHSDIFGSGHFDPQVLNAMLHDSGKRPSLYGTLAEASVLRGGDFSSGSPIWADTDEYLEGEALLPGYLHLFGHSMHGDGPVKVADKAFCLDCMKAFRLTDSPLSLDKLD